MNNSQLKKFNTYLEFVGDMSFRRRIFQIFEWLDSYNVDENSKVLDIGCGEGFYVKLVHDIYQSNITGIEYDQEILISARNNNPDPEINLIYGNAQDLDYEDNSFDVIICTEVLEHLPDDEKAVREIYRVLKPGGIVIVTVPNKNYPFVWDPLNYTRETLRLGHFSEKNSWLGGIWALDHQRLYSGEDLSSLLERGGLKVRELTYLTHYGVLFNVLLLQIGKKILTSKIMPEKVKMSAEKFEGFNNRNSKHNLFKIVLAFLKTIDNKNNNNFNKLKSTLNVAAVAQK